MHLTVMPITAKKEQGKFDLFEAVMNSLKFKKIDLENGDVLVVSSKYISNSQGRLISLDNVNSSQEGISLSRK